MRQTPKVKNVCSKKRMKKKRKDLLVIDESKHDLGTINAIGRRGIGVVN